MLNIEIEISIEIQLLIEKVLDESCQNARIGIFYISIVFQFKFIYLSYVKAQYKALNYRILRYTTNKY